jgi:hypothetical protein
VQVAPIFDLHGVACADGPGTRRVRRSAYVAIGSLQELGHAETNLSYDKVLRLLMIIRNCSLIPGNYK